MTTRLAEDMLGSGCGRGQQMLEFSGTRNPGGFSVTGNLLGQSTFLSQVFVKSSFVETKGGHGVNEKVLSKWSDINKTPRNAVTEGTAPFGRSAASHRCRRTKVIRTELAPYQSARS